MYKNIEKQVKLEWKDLVAYQEGQVVSKTLVQNRHMSMTIFSFDKGEEISTHAAGVANKHNVYTLVLSLYIFLFCRQSSKP